MFCFKLASIYFTKNKYAVCTPLGLKVYISLLVNRCGTRQKSGFNIKQIYGNDYSLTLDCVPPV